MSLSTSLNQQGAMPKSTFNLKLGSQSTPLPKPIVPNTETSTRMTTGMVPNTPPKLGTYPGMIQPTTPLKKTTVNNVDGSSTTNEFHPESTSNTNTSNTSTASTSSGATSSDVPKLGDPAQNAQNTLNSGQQTQNEKQTQAGLLNSGQLTDWEKAAANNVMTAKGIQNFGQFAPYAEAEMHAGDNAGQLGNLITAPDLAGRSAADADLYNRFSNLYGSQANIGLQAAQTAAGRNLAANQGAYAGAQNQAGRATGVGENVLSASIPGQISGSSRLYDPLAGASADTGTSGIIKGANNQSTYDSQQQYAKGQQALIAADTIQNQIVGTLNSNPDLNSNPISLLTNLNEFVSGHLGTAPQQLLAQQINNYLQTLGIDPTSLVSLQNQQKGTLSQLLESLRTTAQAKNDALNPANNPVLNGSSSTSGGSTGGSYSEGQKSSSGELVFKGGKWIKA